jgi:hypothetical protein
LLLLPHAFCCVPLTATDENDNGMVERSEFSNFIFQMAVADLKRMGSVEGR